MPITAADFLAVAPVLTLAAGALAVLVFDLVGERRAAGPSWLAAVGASLLALFAYALPNARTPLSAFSGAYRWDGLTAGFTAIILAALLFTLFIQDPFRQRGANAGDSARLQLPMLLLASVGMVVLAGATSLITAFLGLEILSLALYVLVAMRSGAPAQEDAAREAAFKYLILGSLAAGFLLFGFAFIYGGSGSVAYPDIAAALADGSPLYLRAGLALAFVGFAFKLALAPFHQWAPDVYEGAATPVTAFMSVATKAAGFAALARFAQATGLGDRPALLAPLLALAALSMLVGAAGSLRQRNVKRLLAYSGIAHAGYLFLGLVDLRLGVVAAGVYLATYLFSNLGALAVVAAEEADEPTGYRGLFARRPLSGALLALFMFSLAGIPLTAGFTGKLVLTLAAVWTGSWWLLAALVVATGVSAYAYLRVVGEVFAAPDEAGDHRQTASEAPFTDSATAIRVTPRHLALGAAILAAFGAIGLGIWIEPLIRLLPRISLP